MYLLKNGHQILIKTEDDSIHLINIKDLIDIDINEKEEIIKINTYEKEFLLYYNKVTVYNEEIVNAIRESRLIRTDKSYQCYDRLTVQK